MRIKYSKEDLLIGFFIVLGISYPFLIALLIFFEDAMERKHTMEEVKAFYSFLLGLEAGLSLSFTRLTASLMLPATAL